ncbi:hypothetical protein KXS15_29040 [Sinorhizobium meliloti]|uniref:cobaltochelatase CobT-related protein n=1 Tax=Rhizobium meliloti TaxID=382 RepID=UPI003F17DABD
MAMAQETRSTIQKRDNKGVVRHGGEWLAIWSDPQSNLSEDEKRLADRAQADFEAARKSIAAAARSVANDQALEISFGSHRAATPRGLVLVGPRLDLADLDAARGEADAAAAEIKFSDRALHLRLRPQEPTAARLFDMLEQVRCAANAGRIFPGVAENLAAYQLELLRKSDLLNAHLASLVPLIHGLRMVVRDHLLEVKKPSIQTAAMRMWDQWLRSRYGAYLTALERTRLDQATYAETARTFIAALLAELPTAGTPLRRELRDGAEADDDTVADVTQGANEGISLTEIATILGDDGEPLTEESYLPASQPKRTPYRIFSTQYDRILSSADLADRASLRELRDKALRRHADQSRNVNRLAAALHRRLMAKRLSQWTFDLEEGLIDNGRIERIVLDPAFGYVYKQEISGPARDTTVTLLIDNSGSMRGATIEIAALTADTIARALEKCGIGVEVAGFTSGNWKNGPVFRQWASAGRPENPGRLNDTLHIVYKGADTPLLQAEPAIFGMLLPGLLKENIDGEALRWAARRLLQRPESRKILIVLSDGAPADEATLANNEDQALLRDDLLRTIRSLAQSRAIELSAIGIKHDVGAFYPHAIRIDSATDLASVLIRHLDTLLVQSG